MMRPKVLAGGDVVGLGCPNPGVVRSDRRRAGNRTFASFRNPAWRQPLRRRDLGTKVYVAEGESLGKALRRLRKLLAQQLPRFHRRKGGIYLKPGEWRRRLKNNYKLNARRAEAIRRRAIGIDG